MLISTSPGPRARALASWSSARATRSGADSTPGPGKQTPPIETPHGWLVILHGVKKPADMVHREHFEAWRREPDTQVLLTSDEPDRTWHDRLGVVTELFTEVQIDPGRTIVFMCGPEVMMRYAVPILGQRGVPTNRIYVSLERNMKCAIGLCGHCQFGPEFVCKDGPIFPFSRIERFFGVRGL